MILREFTVGADTVIEARSHGRVTVLAPRGDLDLATAGELRDALDTAVAEGRSLIVIDLSSVDFVDVAGSRPMMEAIAACRDGGCELCLVRPGQGLRRLLDWLRLTELVSPVEDLPHQEEVAALLPSVA